MDMDPKLYNLLLDTFRGELEDQHTKMIALLINFETLQTAKQRESAIQELFRMSHNIKGSAKSVSLDEISKQAHMLEDIFTNWRNSDSKPSKDEIDTTLNLTDGLLDIFKKCMHSMHKNKDETLQVPLSRVEIINAKLGELGIFSLRLQSLNKELGSTHKNLKKIVNNDQKSALSYINILNNIENSLYKLINEFSRDLHVLQQESRIMRLLPVSNLLSPFKRLIREEGDNLDKKVELITTGDNVEIDKYILDALKAPLQHIIRNSIAHGIEAPEIRKKHGKKETGVIRIDVESMADEVMFICKDDGRGLDIETIKQKALDKGLYTKEELNKLSTDKINEIIFISGFSTSKSVSELSGRGVGLDAVLEDLQRIRGKIFIETSENMGCKFILKVPITMATSRGLFVKAKDMTFMLPTIALHGIYDIEIDSLERVDNKWVSIIHNKPVKVYDLLEILKEDHNNFVDGSRAQGILIGNLNKQILILVDEVVNEHDCVIKPLPHPIDKLKSVIGATLTEKAELVAVLNVREILERAQGTCGLTLGEKIDTKNNDTDRIIPNILIVDDAITTRSLAMNAFSAAGYTPICAENGQKALDIIRKRKVDCVVTDIEMPIMGGIDLIKSIRKEKEHSNTPIIIVTAYDNKNYKKQGMDAGASAFLVKKALDTRTLINKVESLL